MRVDSPPPQGWAPITKLLWRVNEVFTGIDPKHTLFCRSESWTLQQLEPISLELKTDCRVLGLRETLKTFAGIRYLGTVMGSGRDSTHRGKMAQCNLDASSSPTSPPHPLLRTLSSSEASYTPPCLASMLPLRSFSLVDVRLDPDTAYSRLVVSKDRKSVHYGVTQQNLPDNPERFYRYNIVLGSQCISSGRHYWEVEVGDRSI